VAAVPFAVFAPGSQSGNFWIHPRIANLTSLNPMLFQNKIPRFNMQTTIISL